MKNLIVYEDNNILICNKSVGMASQSERSFDVDLLSRYIVDQNKNTTTLGGVTKSTTISNF